MKTRTAVLILFGLATLAVLVTLPAYAGAPADRRLQAGQFATPTPGPDGKIIYIVKQDDTLWVIAARAGLTVEQLRALNGIQANDFITPGMKLILGLGGPAQPTQGAAGPPSPTPPPLTATPAFGTGEMCALLFDDVNGNGRLDVGEPPLAGGQVSIADATGKVAAEFTTKAELDANGDPQSQCVPDLPSGDYNVSAAVPAEYNPTTSMNVPVRLDPGDTRYVEFAAQASSAIASGAGGSRSTILGLLGLVLLVVAGGLGYYASRFGRRSPRSLR
jgi:hypothetical protein